MPAALGEVFRKLAEQKASGIEEGQLRPDHVHMIAIPAKYAVLQGIGFIKGRVRSIWSRVWGEEEKFCGTACLGTRVLLSTLGRDETVIRK